MFFYSVFQVTRIISNCFCHKTKLQYYVRSENVSRLCLLVWLEVNTSACIVIVQGLGGGDQFIIH